jgi:hypothetical protein
MNKTFFLISNFSNRSLIWNRVPSSMGDKKLEGHWKNEHISTGFMLGAQTECKELRGIHYRRNANSLKKCVKIQKHSVKKLRICAIRQKHIVQNLKQCVNRQEHCVKKSRKCATRQKHIVQNLRKCAKSWS